MVTERGEDEAYARALRDELDHRIHELAKEDAHAFGKLGTGDVVLIIIVGLLLPGLMVWGCR